MGTKLYVGNLNYNTSELSLRELFSADGREVASVSIIMDRETGRSRGFAFVEMTTPEFAQQALKELDGVDLDGRQIRINEARERERGAPRSFGGGGGGGYGGGGGGGGGYGGGGGGGGGYGAPRPYAGPGGGAPAAPSRFGPNSPPGGADNRRGAGKRGGGGGLEGDRGGKRGGGGRRDRGGDDDGW